MSKKEEVQRLTAEQLFQEEIDALIKAEKNLYPLVGRCLQSRYWHIFVVEKLVKRL